MSIKLKQKIIAAIVLAVNTVVTLLIISLPSPFSIFSNINTLIMVLSYLVVTGTLCLVFQFLAQKTGNKAYFLWCLSLIELLCIVIKLLSFSLNFIVILYSLIILYIFFLFYTSFKQKRVTYLPYILYSCLFLLPILLYMFALIFIYFLFIRLEV